MNKVFCRVRLAKGGGCAGHFCGTIGRIKYDVDLLCHRLDGQLTFRDHDRSPCRDQPARIGGLVIACCCRERDQDRRAANDRDIGNR